MAPAPALAARLPLFTSTRDCHGLGRSDTAGGVTTFATKNTPALCTGSNVSNIANSGRLLPTPGRNVPRVCRAARPAFLCKGHRAPRGDAGGHGRKLSVRTVRSGCRRPFLRGRLAEPGDAGAALCLPVHRPWKALDIQPFSQTWFTFLPLHRVWKALDIRPFSQTWFTFLPLHRPWKTLHIRPFSQTWFTFLPVHRPWKALHIRPFSQTWFTSLPSIAPGRRCTSGHFRRPVSRFSPSIASGRRCTSGHFRRPGSRLSRPSRLDGAVVEDSPHAHGAWRRGDVQGLQAGGAAWWSGQGHHARKRDRVQKRLFKSAFLEVLCLIPVRACFLSGTAAATQRAGKIPHGMQKRWDFVSCGRKPSRHRGALSPLMRSAEGGSAFLHDRVPVAVGQRDYLAHLSDAEPAEALCRNAPPRLRCKAVENGRSKADLIPPREENETARGLPRAVHIR